MHSVTSVIGRLTRAPEMRYTPSGVPVASFTLACDRDFTDQSGKRETDFYDCVAWRKQAETVANHLDKGRLIAATGRFQSRSYETTDGQKRKVWELQVDRVHFLDRRPDGDTSAAMGNEVPGDDVPFDGGDAA